MGTVEKPEATRQNYPAFPKSLWERKVSSTVDWLHNSNYCNWYLYLLFNHNWFKNLIIHCHLNLSIADHFFKHILYKEVGELYHAK